MPGSFVNMSTESTMDKFYSKGKKMFATEGTESTEKSWKKA